MMEKESRDYSRFQVRAECNRVSRQEIKQVIGSKLVEVMAELCFFTHFGHVHVGV